jgi:hypothetical protein
LNQSTETLVETEDDEWATLEEEANFTVGSSLHHLARIAIVLGSDRKYDLVARSRENKVVVSGSEGLIEVTQAVANMSLFKNLLGAWLEEYFTEYPLDVRHSFVMAMMRLEMRILYTFKVVKMDPYNNDLIDTFNAGGTRPVVEEKSTVLSIDEVQKVALHKEWSAKRDEVAAQVRDQE